jgi:hypothetical protein
VQRRSHRCTVSGNKRVQDYHSFLCQDTGAKAAVSSFPTTILGSSRLRGCFRTEDPGKAEAMIADASRRQPLFIWPTWRQRRSTLARAPTGLDDTANSTTPRTARPLPSNRLQESRGATSRRISAIEQLPAGKPARQLHRWLVPGTGARESCVPEDDRRVTHLPANCGRSSR